MTALLLALILAGCVSPAAIPLPEPRDGRGAVEPPQHQESAIEAGVASFVGPEYGPRYLALPEGPGTWARICGEAACVERVSTDAGPDLAMQRAGRVADVSFQDFATLCSCDPWVVGLTRVTVQRGPTVTPPQTSTGQHRERRR